MIIGKQTENDEEENVEIVKVETKEIGRGKNKQTFWKGFWPDRIVAEWKNRNTPHSVVVEYSANNFHS